MVQIEEDPRIGAKGNYKLSEDLLLKLHEVGIFPLWEVASQEQRNAWSQGWLSIRTLNSRDLGEWFRWIWSAGSKLIKIKIVLYHIPYVG